MQRLMLMVSLSCLAVGACKDVNIGSNRVDGGSDGPGGSGGTEGATDVRIAPEAAVCDQLAVAARAQFQSYLDSTSALTCQVDSDCSYVSLSSFCFAPCGLLVGTANIAAASAAADRACDPYFTAGCTVIPTPCPQGPSTCGHGECSICERGQCVWGSPSSRDGAAGGSSGGSSGSGGAAGARGTGGAAVDTGGPTTGGTPGTSDASEPVSMDGGPEPMDLDPAACAFEVTAVLSAKIPTVGIVTWSTSWARMNQAYIEFGLTNAYSMAAPVDLKEPDNRTLLLGMKQNRTYHYRIVATNGATKCTSDDYTITTGSFPSSFPRVTVSTKSTASPISGGFLVVGSWDTNATGMNPFPGGYILDADGEPVWAAFDAASDTTCVRMDYAGTHMWLSRTNVPDGGASVHRMTMDGLVDEDLSDKFVGQHLRLTVLPFETVAFAAYNSKLGCDDIKEYTHSPSGVSRTVVNAAAAQGLTGACQVVDIQYSKDDDALVFSDLANHSLVKVSRSTGATLWVLGGPSSTVAGDTWQGAPWGLHVLLADRVLLFATNSRGAGSSGGSGGTGDGSSAVEMLVNPDKTATQVWSYKSNIQNDVLGDVQRMIGGNTIVAFSTKGILHEVDATGTLLQEWRWPTGYVFGYIEKRPTLYGAPPR